MKIVVFSDIHGSEKCQKLMIKERDADKFVFLGDYFDSKTISFEQQLQNYHVLMELKKLNKKDVELLLGNHEYHYLYSVKEPYSGYQENYATIIQDMLEHNVHDNIFNICYAYDNLIFSHAGITKTWCKNNKIKFKKRKAKLIAQDINNLFKQSLKSFSFFNCVKQSKKFSYDSYGNNQYQSPIWIRPESLIQDKINDDTNMIQIVGHTHVEKIVFNDNLYFVDCWDSCNEYLVCDIDEKNHVQKLFIESF